MCKFQTYKTGLSSWETVLGIKKKKTKDKEHIDVV